MELKDALDKLADVLGRSCMTREEFVDQACHLARKPGVVFDDLLLYLSELFEHECPSVQDAARETIDLLLKRVRQVKDIEKIRVASPLQPGTRLKLFGGYTAAYAKPAWLKRRDFLLVTFIDFAERGKEKMPGAIIEFDEEITLPGNSGRYGLLTLRFVADWTSSETVSICVTNLPRTELRRFALAPPSESEIESHATYEVVPS